MRRAIAAVALLLAAASGDPKYVKDFDFIAETVAREGAAIKAKGLDWEATKKRFRPRFESCKDDVEHVKNVMELLATLRDSHTGVVQTTVKSDELPGKFDGLYGAGLWFGWDQGKLVLRGVMKEHPKAAELPPGSVLVAIGGEPAWLSMERERRRAAKYQGNSTDHSFFASLGNRLLPFGDRQTLDIELLTPELKTRKVEVARWGPGGKAFYPGEAFLPEGLAWAEGAVATMTETPFSKKVGFLAITGSMDERTVAAFDAAFDRLKGMEALLLDGRTMGGGSDDSAWKMNGRLHPKAVDNGRHGKIQPSGSWQHTGPVVVLQSELDVSSAETFLWAATETNRAVSVGRPSGGWGIIPKRFDCPSGLVSFRLGVNDRPTPIKGIHTEGAGWPPDVILPFGPEFAARADPDREVATEILRVLAAGVPFEETRSAFHELFAGNATAFRAFAKTAATKAKGFEGEKLAKLVLDDLKAELRMEKEMLRLDAVVPDFVGTSRRLVSLTARAKAAGLAPLAAELDQAIKSAKAETAAQEALFALPDPKFAATPEQQKAYLSKHGATKTAKVVRETVWK